MSKLIPLYDKVIVKPKEEGEALYGNIIIPDMGKEMPHVGTIIDIGPGRYNNMGQFIPTTFKVGDKVILPKIGPVRVDYDGEEYLVTSENNVLALIPNENE